MHILVALKKTYRTVWVVVVKVIRNVELWSAILRGRK